jgi:hypothetical protein
LTFDGIAPEELDQLGLDRHLKLGPTHHFTPLRTE